MQERRNEMKGILDEISDIIHLDVFSTEDVDQKLKSADKKGTIPYINSESLIMI